MVTRSLTIHFHGRRAWGWPHSLHTLLGALLKLYLGTKFDSSADVENYLSCESIILSLTTFVQQKKFKELHLVEHIFFSFIN